MSDRTRIKLEQRKTRQWWNDHRIAYNKGLIIAGVLAFVFYVTLGSALIHTADEAFEITLFTMFFQGIGYLFMMGIANIIYELGPFIDIRYNKGNDERFRKQLFNIGYWFSFALPFSIPIMVIVHFA